MTRITDITCIGLECDLGEVNAYGMSRGLFAVRAATLIKVETDAGITGIGEAWGPGAMVAAALEVAKPYFIDREIYDHALIAPYLYAQRYHLGYQGTLTSCLGGINIALYDAIGKAQGLPLHKLLGGLATDRVPAYASDGYFASHPDNQLADQLAAFRDQGFPGVKIKIGRAPADDARRVALARDILGPEVLLMVDVNGNYTADLALDSLRRIEAYDIHFCEEPLPPTDFDGYADLRRRAPIPIAAGEALYTAHDFKRLIDGRGVDIVQPDLTICGGFDAAREIATLARLGHIRLSPHVWGGAIGLAAAVHFIAAQPAWPHTDSIPFPMLLEYDRGRNPLRDELLTAPIACVDGHLTVPTGPGLGVELDPEAVEKYRVT